MTTTSKNTPSVCMSWTKTCSRVPPACTRRWYGAPAVQLIGAEADGGPAAVRRAQQHLAAPGADTQALIRNGARRLAVPAAFEPRCRLCLQ